MFLLTSAPLLSAALLAPHPQREPQDTAASAISAFVKSLSHTDFLDREVNVEIKINGAAKTIELSRSGTKPNQRYVARLTINSVKAQSWSVALPRTYSKTCEPERYAVMEVFLSSTFKVHDRTTRFKLSLTSTTSDRSEWLIIMRLYPLNVVDNFVSLMARRTGSTFVLSE